MTHSVHQQRSRSTALFAVCAALVALTLSLLPRGTSASVPFKGAPQLGQVRYIHHALSVQPPKQRAGKGKVKQSLYNAYLLTTKKQDKASVSFRDGSVLNMNQLTQAVLKSTSVTQVKQGEVEEMVTPGTNHQIVTSSATASAVGTVYDVKIAGNRTIITVVEGAVLVSNASGSVIVRSGEQTHVKKGKAPTPPAPVNTTGPISWATSIPVPTRPPGVNIALSANGGSIVSFSSQRSSFEAIHAIDGDLSRGWVSAPGQTSGQSLVVGFSGTQRYPVSTVLIDCAAPAGAASGAALKDFSILVSTTTSATSAFHTVTSGSCAPRSGLQVFPLPSHSEALYVELQANSNQGGADGIAVTELEVISPQQPVVLGTPTPFPTATATSTPIATATPTATFQPTATATATTITTPTDTPTATPIPLYMFSFTGLSTSFTEGGAGAPVSWVVAPIQGSACGTDPLSVSWTGSSTLSPGSSAPWSANFAQKNPRLLRIVRTSLNNVEQARVEVSIQLVPGPNPIMMLVVVSSGQVSDLVVQPSQVPIQVTQVASC